MRGIVIESFYDLRDGGHEYRAGDTYPRPGYSPTVDRWNELTGYSNRRGVPLVAPDPDPLPEIPAASPKRTAKRRGRNETVNAE